MNYDTKRVNTLSNRLVSGITSQLPNVIRNGDPSKTYPGCINLSFAYVEGESLLMALKVKFNKFLECKGMNVISHASMKCDENKSKNE